jgi:TRAP-type C4-dicarboxylate transport system permease small subunit
MEKISDLYGRLLNLLFGIACLILLGMTLMIGADVITRNLAIGEIPWSNEVSESMLYLMTVLAAPWLLRQGQHIRVDIVLRALPRPVAWYCEWIADLLGFGCSVVLCLYGWKVTLSSYADGALTYKTLITPEWWSLAPVTLSFLLLAIEFLFRMHRLYRGERGPRDEAVSAS